LTLWRDVRAGMQGAARAAEMAHFYKNCRQKAFSGVDLHQVLVRNLMRSDPSLI
jgi:hypothetical protein